MGFKSAGGMAMSYIFMSIIRFAQFVLALAVCGLYGVDLQAARNAGAYVDGRWVSFDFLFFPFLLGAPDTFFEAIQTR